MGAVSKNSRDMMARLGFDVLDRLEAMQERGVRSIDVDECAPALPAALRVWEDSNYPYRLPGDLRAFLVASDGFSLSWTSEHHNPSGGENPEVVIGRMRINHVKAITRVPLDADDLRDIASSRVRAAAAAAATVMRPGLKHTPRPPSFVDSRRNAPTKTGASFVSDNDTREYGVAAFSLDSSCEVGGVALIYGGAPISSNTSGQTSSSRGRGSNGRAASVAELAIPEVWLQDMSCRWHFLADSFTSYLRIMVVHLGVLGWQQAFSPVGLSPSTEQCMRVYCQDRLLFDQMEWRKERAARKAAKEAEKSGHPGGDEPAPAAAAR